MRLTVFIYKLHWLFSYLLLRSKRNSHIRQCFIGIKLLIIENLYQRGFFFSIFLNLLNWSLGNNINSVFLHESFYLICHRSINFYFFKHVHLKRFCVLHFTCIMITLFSRGKRRLGFFFFLHFFFLIVSLLFFTLL